MKIDKLQDTGAQACIELGRIARAQVAQLAEACTLAEHVIEYFGTDEIDPRLTNDIKLRAMAVKLLESIEVVGALPRAKKDG